MEKKDIL